LKAHYPCEFLAALLCTETDNTDKITKYTSEARKLGIEIAPCDINESRENFTPTNGKIRFGLVAIKGLGSGIVSNILQERTKNGNFTSFHNFCERMIEYDINKKAIEGLIKAGSFDNLAKRSQLMAVYEHTLQDLQKTKKTQITGQFSMFDTAPLSEGGGDEVDGGSFAIAPSLPNIPEFPFSQLLALERESTGIFMSGSPLDEYDDLLNKIKTTNIEEFFAVGADDPGRPKVKDEAKVTVAGVLVGIKKKNTKNGASMAFAQLQDRTGSLEIVMFPQTLTQYSDFVSEGAVVIIDGKASIKGDLPPSVAVNSIKGLNNESLKKLYVKIPNEEILEQLKPKLAFFKEKLLFTYITN